MVCYSITIFHKNGVEPVNISLMDLDLSMKKTYLSVMKNAPFPAQILINVIDHSKYDSTDG